MPYSCRSARTGCSAAARRAGSQQAARPIASSSAVTAPNTTGSCAEVRKSRRPTFASASVPNHAPTSPSTIRYEATITDPQTFTHPWKMSMNLYKRLGEDAQLQQFKCIEFVEELLYGGLRKEPLK